MCIHGIEEKCVQSERARVKYSYEPTKKKRRRETVCKERDFGEAKSHIFPSPAIFSLFFLFEGETKAKTNQKNSIIKRRVHVYPPLCHILLPLEKKGWCV